MKLSQGLSMANPSTGFISAGTRTEINNRLQELGRAITIGGPKSPKCLDRPQVSTSIDLNILLDLPIARLLQQPEPVAILADICRLLFKKGDISSLRLALGLAHKIYGLSRARQESDRLFYLFKGIAEIGLGRLDLGIKNVNIGLRESPTSALHPVDLCLGHWALMSAAVRSREINRALPLAEQWRQAAADGHLKAENCRADLVIQIFHLLVGDEVKCSENIMPLVAAAPEEWRETAAFLQDWTAALGSKNPAPHATVAAPYPLFLGLEWYNADPPTYQKPSQADFGDLCRLRRSWCDSQVAETVSIEQLLAVADLAARWELPQFLREIEAVLKRRDPERYLQFSVGRVLGKSGIESLTCFGGSPGNEVITQEQVIIWLMDVRGYTRLAEHWSAERNFAFLSPLFKIVHEELEESGGLILEFAGDCIIIAFNTTYTPAARMQQVLFHTARCLRRIHTLDSLARPAETAAVKVGIGIDRGTVALGFLGGLRRCHPSVLGRAVNRASRIEGLTKVLDRSVLISARCFDQESPEVWEEPRMVNFTLRRAGRHKMRHVSQSMQLIAVSPLVQYWVDFVPMGFVAFPEPGVVYIDTGNSTEPGIIDHHFQGGRAGSACELLLKHPELMLDHLQGVPAVDPKSGTNLQGLGELLEAAEEKKRQELGRERPVEPRRYPTNNSDPWYFGWGHGFTIVDSPREGTVLTAEEVRGIHEGGRPLLF